LSSHRELSPSLPPAAPLRDQLRRRLRAAGPGLALRVREAPVGPRRALLLALLEDAAARSGGGDTLDRGTGDLLLIGASPNFARQVADRIDAIGALPPVERHELPAAIETLLDWATEATPPAPTRPGDPAALDDRLAAVPPARLLQTRPILRRNAGTTHQVAQRLEVDCAALATVLGDLAEDPDMVAHAEHRLAVWAVAQPDPTVFGATADLPLLLPLPLYGGPVEPGNGPRVGLASLTAAALPMELAARRAALAALGWGLAVGPIEAPALAMIEPAAVAADLFLLQWSAALDGRAAATAVRRFDPRAVVLCGCDTPAALDWGRALGIRRFAGLAAAA